MVFKIYYMEIRQWLVKVGENAKWVVRVPKSLARIIFFLNYLPGSLASNGEDAFFTKKRLVTENSPLKWSWAKKTKSISEVLREFNIQEGLQEGIFFFFRWVELGVTLMVIKWSFRPFQGPFLSTKGRSRSDGEKVTPPKSLRRKVPPSLPKSGKKIYWCCHALFLDLTRSSRPRVTPFNSFSTFVKVIAGTGMTLFW